MGCLAVLEASWQRHALKFGVNDHSTRAGASTRFPPARRPAPSFSPAGQPASAAATRGSGGSTARKRPLADAARSGLFATPALRWIGRLPVKRAVLLFTGTVLAGTILTIVMGQEPGFLL